MLYCYNFYTCYLFGNSRYNLACRLKRNNLLGNGILLFWYWDLKTFPKMEIKCFFFRGPRLFCFHTEDWNLRSTCTEALQNYGTNENTEFLNRIFCCEEEICNSAALSIHYDAPVWRQQLEWNFKCGNWGVVPPWPRHFVVVVGLEPVSLIKRAMPAATCFWQVQSYRIGLGWETRKLNLTF